MLRRVLTALCSIAFVSIASAQAPPVSQKSAVVASIDARAPELARLSDQVWAFAETALLETKSAEALAAYAEAKGFRVRRGVAEMPTAFVAEYGQGAPVIGVLGEYDALPGLSQKASRRSHRSKPVPPATDAATISWASAPSGRLWQSRSRSRQGRSPARSASTARPRRRTWAANCTCSRRPLQGCRRRALVASRRREQRRHAEQPGHGRLHRGVSRQDGARGLRPVERPQRRRWAGDLYALGQLPARTRQAHSQDSLLHRRRRPGAKRRSRLCEALVLGPRFRS